MNFWRGRRVLVTGHTGFKGSWMTLWLAQRGAGLTGYALKPPTEPSLYGLARVGKSIQSIEGDIRDASHVRSAFEKAQPEIVFHMAAQTLVRESYARPLETFDVNVIGTAAVLDAVRQCDSVRAVIIVTSDKCYENREWPWAYRESDRLGGQDPYSSSKACTEMVAAAYRSSFFSNGRHPARIATVRAGNVIGGGDWANDRLIPDLMRGFLSGSPARIRNPRATRPWQFVLEPICGYLMLAERLCAPEGDSFGQAWNFGPDDEGIRTVQWIVDRLCELWGDGAEVELDASEHPHEAQSLKLDSSNARLRLGWSPLLDAATALCWTAQWYQGYAVNPRSAAELAVRDIDTYEKLIDGRASMPLL